MMYSCTSSDSVKEEDILVSYDNKVLTRNEVLTNIGMCNNSEDSIIQMEEYIKKWINAQLMNKVAINNISDLDRIEKKVEEYRQSLLAYEYRKRMILNDETIFSIPKDSLVAFYDLHKTEFKLEEPIIKGIFIKIAADADRLKDLKKWYKSDKVDDIDKLEKYGLKGAISYEYFRDKWITWTDIEKNIPKYFSDPNSFVKTNKSYECDENGFVYLLNITDYREKGDIMPYGFAESRIKEIFVNSNQRKYDAMLQSQLYDEALSSGELKINYNPKNKK
ncbi:MAG: hypothetical protein PHR45_08405 [Muribaculaceae bacterium]|nr:hypothetical protein [Muribaculaceae bacterium]